jgi:hypothetical protein
VHTAVSAAGEDLLKVGPHDLLVACARLAIPSRWLPVAVSGWPTPTRPIQARLLCRDHPDYGGEVDPAALIGRRSSSHDGTSVMHPVVDPAEACGLIGPDYLAAALADLAASVHLVIFPGGVQLFPSLLDALRVDDVAE